MRSRSPFTPFAGYSAVLIPAAVLFSVCLSLGFPAHAALDDGLVAYWSFDAADARDDSGNGHDGRVTGCTSVPEGDGPNHLAYEFDGETSHIVVPHSDAFDFGEGPFTLSCCVRTTAETSRRDSRDDLVSKGDATIRGFTLSLANNSVTFFYGWHQAYFGTTPINDGQWHHIAATRDTGKRVALYLDGKPERVGIVGVGDTPDKPGMYDVTTRDPLIIGRHGTKQVSFFTGKLDEVRIYRRALSTEEIQRLHEHGGVSVAAVARKPPEPETAPSTLHDQVAGTRWQWHGCSGETIYFGEDGYVEHAGWTARGLTTKWRVVDEHTILFQIVEGRSRDRYAILIFSDDFRSFTGYNFHGGEKLNRSRKIE